VITGVSHYARLQKLFQSLKGEKENGTTLNLKDVNVAITSNRAK
jgi:hypothetical protein